MVKEHKCKRCGECCKGSPRLSEEDVEKILKLGVNKDDFIENINGVDYMKMINDQCVFLWLQKGGESHCKIYSSRPEICRIYPGMNIENCQPEKWFFDEYLEKKNGQK